MAYHSKPIVHENVFKKKKKKKEREGEEKTRDKWGKMQKRRGIAENEFPTKNIDLADTNYTRSVFFAIIPERSTFPS